MSAWDAGSQEEKIEDVEKKFEDNFVTLENRDFQKLEDSEQYLQNLGLLLLSIQLANDLKVTFVQNRVYENSKRTHQCYSS